MKIYCKNMISLLLLSAVCIFAGSALGAVKIDAVFFAQTHVQKPDSPWFKLVGDRAALIKVNVVSPSGDSAPPVVAQLTLKGAVTNLALRGPAKLPVSIPLEPGVVEHRFDNSFTSMIPKEWVQRGLQVTVKAGDETAAFPDLKVGAPTVVNMTMFDIHYFAYETKDYVAGTLEELEAKWPVAKLNVQRVPRILFDELIVPARAGLTATRCRSPEDYLKKTGKAFDGEQMTGLQWKDALQLAGGQTRMNLFLVNIYGVNAGGDAWDFGGVTRVGNVGTLNHELGHALGRPHLNDEPEYPHRDVMYGIVGRGPHVGPTWGFDPRIGLPGAQPGMPYFIPPVVQSNSVGQTPGMWKRDPMQGGGSGDEEKGFLMRYFSDYSMHKMQEYLENKVVVWSESLKSYATWDDKTASYSKILPGDGYSLPIERNVEVISVIAAVSAVTPQANFIYRPIGPYVSGMIKLYDPTVAEDRALAAKGFAPQGGCDVSLRVTQGGKVKTYMLPVEWRTNDDPLVPWSLTTRGVNLPARDGKVTRVELLLTPDAEKNGLPDNPKVLDTRICD